MSKKKLCMSEPTPAEATPPQRAWRFYVDDMIHGYLGIDNDTLWSIVRDNTPSLLAELHALKKAADSGLLK